MEITVNSCESAVRSEYLPYSTLQQILAVRMGMFWEQALGPTSDFSSWLWLEAHAIFLGTS